MARQSVVVLSADKAIGLGKDANTAEGFYLGFKMIETSYGAAKLHILSTDQGTLGVYGFHDLDTQLAGVDKGVFVWLTYKGKSKASPGKNPRKLVAVDQDPELKMEGIPSGAAAPASHELENSEELYADSGLDLEEELAYEEPAAAPIRATRPVAPATVTSTTVNKTQELLNRARANRATRAA